MSETDAALYEAPFEYVAKHVRPIRANNRVKKLREYWFRHERPRPDMWSCIGNPLTLHCDAHDGETSTLCVARRSYLSSKHTYRNCSRRRRDIRILHSRFHEAWSLRLGTNIGKGNDPRYTPTTTFETFAFPDGLSPEIVATDYTDDPRAIAIADASRRLVALRDRWLNPPEWVEWLAEPVPGYPKRPVLSDVAAAKQLKARTLTNLYNAFPQWLADAHAALDIAVASAYGWDSNISNDDALEKLLALNASRADL